MSLPRLDFVRVARGFSVLAMIAIHTLMFYGNDATTRHPLSQLVFFFAEGPAVPVFVVIMGVLFGYGRQRTIQQSLSRAVTLMVLGYALNAAKFLVPLFVSRDMPSELLTHFGLLHAADSERARFFLCIGDILHLAALSLALVSVSARFLTSSWSPLVLAATIAVVSPYTWFDSDLHVVQLFVGRERAVYFPFFPWSAFVLTGLGLGRFLRTHGQLDRAMRKVLVMSTLALALGMAITLTDESFHFGDLNRMGPGGVLYSVGLCVLWLSLTYFALAKLGKWRAVMSVCAGLGWLGDHVTEAYVLHWLLLMGALGSVGYRKLDGLGTFVIYAAVVLYTCAAVWAWRALRTKARLTNLQPC